jgi:hypothetical protein
MPSLKEFKQADTIDSAYLDKAVVYLESEEDVQIIKERWFFDEGRYVEFKSVDVGLGGGCTQVINQVGFDRSKGVNAFGIVDRDALLQCRLWDFWWEIDDLTFASNKPLGEHIKVLKRWEIENYLLTPNEVEIVLSDKDFRSKRSIQAIIKELLEHAEDVKLLSAAAFYCHKQGYSFPNGFAGNKKRDDLQSEIENYLSKHLDDYNPSRFKGYIEKIESFAEGINDIVFERWERLNRLLDGKRMLRRFGLYGSHPNDRRGDLARHIRVNNMIDQEILDYLEIFKDAGRY